MENQKEKLKSNLILKKAENTDKGIHSKINEKIELASKYQQVESEYNNLHTKMKDIEDKKLKAMQEKEDKEIMLQVKTLLEPQI